MNLPLRFRKPVVTTALMIVIGGTAQLSVAGEPQPYVGVAALCAVDPTTAGDEFLGNGIIIDNWETQFYRIESNSELLKGWEALSAKYKVTKSGNVFSWGTAYLRVDGYDLKNDALKDNFNFLVQAGPPAISGTYEGTGELEGVKVTYHLTPYPISIYPDPDLMEMCAESVPYCDDAECDYSPMGFWGWSMTGVIYDNRTE